MKKIIFLFLIFCYFTLAFGQKRVIDSLNSILSRTHNDTLQLVLSERLTWEWVNVNSDSSLRFANKYMKLSQNLNYRLNKADAMRLIAFNYTYIANYPRALEILYKALSIATENDSKNNILPHRYLTMQDIPDHLQSSKKYELYIEGNVHFGFWFLYFIRSRNKCAAEAAKIHEIAKMIGADDLLAYALAWKGYTNNNPDSALFYLLQSRDLLVKAKARKFLGPYTELIAHAYRNKEDHENELKYLRLGLHYNLIYYNVRNSGFSYMELAWYYAQRNVDSAIYYARRALDLARTGNYPDIEFFAIKSLKDAYKFTDQRDSTNKYLDILVDLLSKSTNAESIRQFENVQMNQQLQERELRTAKEKYQNRMKLLVLLAGLTVL